MKEINAELDLIDKELLEVPENSFEALLLVIVQAMLIRRKERMLIYLN